MEKMFVHIAKKANFTDALKTKYANSIVFLKDTQEIWTHDTFYAIPDSYKTRITNAESAINALKAIYSFDTISDGANTVQATAAAKTIKFTGGGATSVTVGADGVKITTPQDTLVTGTSNGTVKFNGTDVAVKGLGSAAYTPASDYATAAQGTLANNAVPKTTTVSAGGGLTGGGALSANVTIAHGAKPTSGTSAAPASGKFITGVTLDTYGHVASVTGAAIAQADVTGLVNALAAKAPLASPALTGTPTAPTAAAGTNNTQIATTAFVKAAVDTLGNAVAAALRYVGTIGTGGDVTALPASHNIGDVYIVKTAGTYAGQVCEVGDMIICSKTGSAATDADWQVIQANINGAITGTTDMTADQLIVGNGSKTAKPLAAGSNGQVLKMVGGVPAWAADTDTNTTYTFANGTNGSFTVTPSGGSAQTVSVGKPATATSADQAAKLTTARTVAVSGAVSGSVSFDGTKDVTISTTLANIASNKVAAMTGYTKPAAVSAISATDTLNAAIGKLEAMFDWEEL